MKTLVKTYFSTLSAFAPKAAGSQAFDLFQRPLNMKIRPREKSFFEKAKSFKIKHHLEDILCYEIGPGDGDLVILVHGWESNAASMSGIGERLAELGHRVVLFNLPAHGFSKLKKSNLKISKDAFLTVLSQLSPAEPFSVVAHSFGSAVTAYGLSKTTLQAKNLVFLSTPNKMAKIFEDYSQFIGLKSRAHGHMTDIASDLLSEPLHGVSVISACQKAFYDHLTIIHDEQDKIIPKTNAIDVHEALDDSSLHLVRGKGHYRMLWDQEVIDLTVAAVQKKQVAYQSN